MKPTAPHKGRGAVSNPDSRYHTTRHEPVDDGWENRDDPSAPRTEVSLETPRTIISRNRSPDLPFEQSINPYRGCEHGCVYCLSGDTLILMGDGSTRLLADIRIGDVIYGTIRQGWYRRYVKTRVLDHWSVVKPGYFIRLEDGTTLVAGADHRFLTERGWKFVTGTDRGSTRRPHLTPNNKLMGTGSFARPLAKNADYRRGYLCGMIRGDGLLASYSYPRAGRHHGNQHQFRLALCDQEALERAREYLQDFAVATSEFVFQQAVSGRRRLYAIRTHARANVERIRELIAWPENPPIEWCAGFLAGIFDAEGSYSQGILRISNADKQILTRIGDCLQALNFRFSREAGQQHRSKPVQVIRLNGGLREHLRFFHSVDPAITRKRDIAGQAVKSDARLRVICIKPLAKALRLYDITTETGDFVANGVISHNCYARPSHAYLNLSPGLDFETKLTAKPDAAKLVRRELEAPGYRCSPIALGSNTDPYQPIERRYRITREILEVLYEFNHPVTITTKSALIERDLDLLQPMAQKRLVQVYLSIPTLQPELARQLEPRATAPQRRLKAIASLRQAGVPVGVLVAPVIPVLTEPELESILKAAGEAGALTAGYVLLRLPQEVADLFTEWLYAHFPLQAEHVLSRIRASRGGHLDDPRFGHRMRGAGVFADLIVQRFRLACRRLKLDLPLPPLETGLFRPRPVQMELF